MADPYDLSEIDKATLRALADACNFSLGAHAAEGLIMKRLSPIIRSTGDGTKSLKKLHKLRLCYKHPTRGEMTYNITQDGLRIAQTYNRR